MKILHVIADIDAGGGAETCLCRLVSAMRQQHLSHHVVVLQGEGGLSSYLRSLNVSVEHLGMKPGSQNPLQLLRLRRLMREKKADVVHAWMRRANLAAALAGAQPLVWSIHNSLGDNFSGGKWRGRLGTVGLRCMVKRPSAIVYVSSRSAKQHAAVGFPEDRTHVIPNGWDTDAFRPNHATRARLRTVLNVSDGDIVLGHIARWHPAKDHTNLFCAAAELVRHVPSVVLCLVGNGITEENTDLSRMIAKFGLNGHVRLCGLRQDISDLINAFDVATLSSVTEACPLVVGEAMACGVPFVGTDVGDVKEMVGECGIVVPSKDPKALARAWLEFTNMSSERRRELGAAARKRIISRYSVPAWIDGYTKLYARVASGHAMKMNGNI